jgi:hypothetical protein
MKMHERTNDIKIHFLPGSTIQGNPSYLSIDLVGTGLVTVILRSTRNEGGDMSFQLVGQLAEVRT